GEFDKVGALRLGADDYVTKPFALAELMARIAAVLRRAPQRAEAAEPPPADAARLRFGAVDVDLTTRTVTRRGQEIRLTHLEFELLTYLLSNPARVFGRESLLREVWGLKAASSRTVDNFILQLRSKL